MWDKDIVEDQKPWPCLALNREFSKGRGLKPKDPNENIVYSNVSETGSAGNETSSRRAIFWNFFEKKAILMPLDHISHLFKTI